MSMNKSQKDLIVISDSKVIKVYKKPITKKILNSFSEIPKSATEISKTISFPKEKIYYHIKNLLKHDLLIIASADVVKGIEQKMYLPAAKVFKVSIKGSIDKEKTPEQELSLLPDIIEKNELNDVKAKRDIADRRRIEERRKQARRNTKRRIDNEQKYNKKNRRNVVDRRIISDNRVLKKRRIVKERRFSPSDYKDNKRQNTKRVTSKAQSIKYKNLLIGLNGVKSALTFIHSGNYVTSVYCKLRSNGFQIINVSKYELPYKIKGYTINTLSELIINVSNQFISPSDNNKIFLGIHSEEYQYEMTYLVPKVKGKKVFEKSLKKLLTNNYGIKEEESIVDYQRCSDRDTASAVCFTKMKLRVEKDYHDLKSKGLIPRYNTSIPKILHNIYTYFNLNIKNEYSLLIYIDTLKTHCVFVKQDQIIDSREISRGLQYFTNALNDIAVINKKSTSEEEHALHFLSYHGLTDEDMGSKIIDGFPLKKAKSVVAHLFKNFISDLKESIYHSESIIMGEGYSGMLIQKAFITGVGSHIKHLDKKMSNELGITVENFTKYNTAYINGDNTDSSFFGSFRENNVFKKKKTVTARLEGIKKKISAHEKAVESIKSPESAKYKLTRLEIEKNAKIKAIDGFSKKLITASKDFKEVKDSYTDTQEEINTDLTKVAEEIDQESHELVESYKKYEVLGKRISQIEYDSDHPKVKKDKIEAAQDERYQISLKNAARSRNNLLDDKETIEKEIENYESGVLKLEESIKLVNHQLQVGADEISIFEYLKQSFQTTATAFTRRFLEHLKSIDQLNKDDLNLLQRSGYLLTQNTKRIDDIYESFKTIIAGDNEVELGSPVDGRNGIEIRKKLLKILALVLEAPENLIHLKNLTSSVIKINDDQDDLLLKSKNISKSIRSTKREIKENKKNLISLKREIGINENDLSTKIGSRDNSIAILDHIRKSIDMIQDLDHHKMLIKELEPGRRSAKDDLKTLKGKMDRLNVLIDSCNKKFDMMNIDQHDLNLDFKRGQEFLNDQVERHNRDENKIKNSLEILEGKEKSNEENYSNVLSYISQLEKQCVSKKSELDKLNIEKLPLIKSYENRRNVISLAAEKEITDLNKEREIKIKESQKTKSVTINNFFQKERRELDKQLASFRKELEKSEKAKAKSQKKRLKVKTDLSELKKKKNPQILELRKKVKNWESDLTKGRRIQDRLDTLETKKNEWDKLVINERDDTNKRINELRKSIKRKNSDEYKLFLKDGLRRFYNDGDADEAVNAMAGESIKLDLDEIRKLEEALKRLSEQYDSFMLRYRKKHKDILKLLKPLGGRRKTMISRIQNAKKRIGILEQMIKKSIGIVDEANQDLIVKENQLREIKRESTKQIDYLSNLIKKIPEKKKAAIIDIEKKLGETLKDFAEKESSINEKVSKKIHTLNVAFSKEELSLTINDAENKMMFYIDEIEKSNDQINFYISERKNIATEKSKTELALKQLFKKHKKIQDELLENEHHYDEKNKAIEEEKRSNRTELSIIEEQLLTLDKQKDEFYGRLLEIEKDYDESKRAIRELEKSISVPGKRPSKKKINKKQLMDTLSQMEKDTMINVERSEALIKELNIVIDNGYNERSGLESSMKLLENDLEYYNTDLSRVDTLIKNNSEHISKIASDHRNALNKISDIKELYSPVKIILNDRIAELYTIVDLKQKDRDDLEYKYDELREDLKNKRVEAAIADQELAKINEGMKKALEKSFYEQDESNKSLGWEVTNKKANTYADLARKKIEYKELFNSILEAEKHISRLKNQEISLKNLLSENEKISYKKIKQMEDNCTNLELSIAKEKNELSGIEQEVKQLSSLAFNYGDRIQVLNKELKEYREKQTEYKLTLKELDRSVSSIREKSQIIERDLTFRKSNTIEIDYMANLGLLMDPETSLNILPTQHKQEFKYFRPNQILQKVFLGLIMVLSLGAYNQRAQITALESHLPLKQSELKLLDIREKMKQSIDNENMLTSTYGKLVLEDQRVSKDMVVVLKYLSQNMPKRFRVTDLRIEKDESKINPYRSMFGSSDIVIAIDGFFESNLEKSSKYIAQIKTTFERAKMFKSIDIGEGKKLKNKKTQYSISMVR